MHAHHGVLQALSHLGDGQGGSVGSKDGALLAQSVQLSQQFLLHGHVLSDALDDQIGIGGSVHLLHQDAGHDVVSGSLIHLALGDLLSQRGSQLILMALSALDAGSIHQSGVALRCENLGNAAAHSACAKYCDFHDCFPPIKYSCWKRFNHQAGAC